MILWILKYRKLLGWGAAVLLVLLAWNHYDGLRDEKARLANENTKLTTALDAQGRALVYARAQRDSLLLVHARWAQESEAAGAEGRRIRESYRKKPLVEDVPDTLLTRLRYDSDRLLWMLREATGDSVGASRPDSGGAPGSGPHAPGGR